MRTDDSIEVPVWEGHRLDGRLDEADGWMACFGIGLDDKIDAIEINPSRLGMTAQEIDEITGPTTDIDGFTRQEPGCDRVKARAGVVRVVLNTRHALIDASVGLWRHSRDLLTESLEVVDEAAPMQPEQPAHRTRISQYGRQPLFENVPDLVDRFATHY